MFSWSRLLLHHPVKSFTSFPCSPSSFPLIHAMKAVSSENFCPGKDSESCWKSAVYRVKTMGDNAVTCGAPVLLVRVLDTLPVLEAFTA